MFFTNIHSLNLLIHLLTINFFEVNIERMFKNRAKWIVIGQKNQEKNGILSHFSESVCKNVSDWSPFVTLKCFLWSAWFLFNAVHVLGVTALKSYWTTYTWGQSSRSRPCGTCLGRELWCFDLWMEAQNFGFNSFYLYKKHRLLDLRDKCYVLQMFFVKFRVQK